MPLVADSAAYLGHIREYAKFLEQQRQLPPNQAAWATQRATIRRGLVGSWGGDFPRQHAPLKPRIVDRLPRAGYLIEKLFFQTWPGVTMAAHAYVPEGAGPFPAVLCVHGHWPLAKQEPRVQARCIGLAKLGFFVLAVDAFGAGERGTEPALGEYHGAAVASTLWPTGRALAGVQVYENMRAVDYLQTRPEVAPDRIGITGTSGGGNQTMYAGAWDERFRCVVPVCSVGSYQAYLGAACCMCEVVPSALSYTEEWGILGLIAPRPLLVINATRDVVQFSVAEAQRTVKRAQGVYKLYGHADRIRQLPIESGHDYNQPMREAMYGWMTFYLKGEGNGEPIPEPEIETEAAEGLRCWSAGARPRSFLTLPQFAGELGRAITAKHQPPVDIPQWETERLWRREGFGRAFGAASLTPRSTAPRRVLSGETTELRSDDGITISVQRFQTENKPRKRVLLLDLERDTGKGPAPLVKKLLQKGVEVVRPVLRATGQGAPLQDRIAHARDHNSAQWGLWVGKPLLTQWVRDVMTVLDALPQGQQPIGLAGVGAAGMVALSSAVADDRIREIALVDSPLTLVADEPPDETRVGILVPDMLRRIGDVAQLVALCSPRRVLIAGGRSGAGKRLTADAQRELTTYPRRVYHLLSVADRLVCDPVVDEEVIAGWLAEPRASAAD